MIHKIMTCILDELRMKQPECQPAGTLEASSDSTENKNLMPTSDAGSEETNNPSRYHVEFH